MGRDVDVSMRWPPDRGMIQENVRYDDFVQGKTPWDVGRLDEWWSLMVETVVFHQEKPFGSCRNDIPHRR